MLPVSARLMSLFSHQAMKNQVQQAPNALHESPEAAEQAFYRAFSECDVGAMAQVWAEHEVICIHPGSMVLQGRNAVLQSWAEILGDAARPAIGVQSISQVRHGDLAVHVVEEHITPRRGSDASPSVILATNIFRLIGDAWYMVEHHASLPLIDRAARRPKSALH